MSDPKLTKQTGRTNELPQISSSLDNFYRLLDKVPLMVSAWPEWKKTDNPASILSSTYSGHLRKKG